MRFFINYRFWLPLLILFGLELTFGSGLYEPFVKGTSHSGVTIKIKEALKTIGHENVDYVTMGDSRADLGLDHRAISDIASKFGKKHISIAMPGSHFTSFTVESDFLHKNFNNIKGVLLAISSVSTTRIFNGYYELAIITPFKSYGDYSRINKSIPFNINNIESYGLFSFLFQYRKDIEDFVTSPRQRIRGFHKEQPWMDVLAHRQYWTETLCSIDLETPEACVDSVSRAMKSGGDMSSNSLNQYEKILMACNEYGKSKNRVILPTGERAIRIRDSWLDLFRSLTFKKRPIVVLLPNSHFLYSYHFFDGIDEWALSLLKPLAESNEIILLDYSRIFSSEDECRYFYDPIHLNAAGAEVITKRLEPVLENYYQAD
ncbi:MAG: hypothetical protein ABFD97_23365 [Syntrophobacter sp.]